MLKLKYLFNNKDLAQMVLSNWEYDNDDADLLKSFRISSNAVYWCKNQGETFFLRFSPSEEKNKTKILAELEFLRYLRGRGYSAAETIVSKGGNELEVVNTPWGQYNAVAFKKASGKSLDTIQLTDDIVYGLGKSLGKLHKMSSEFTPSNSKRNNWREVMDWMENILLALPGEIAAIKELNQLKNYLIGLPANKENYGLIHYDFQPDNVFYDEITTVYNTIDFDDSMYHWYAMDIGVSINSIKEDIPSTQCKSIENKFIEGYRMEFSISDDMLKLLPIFQRFENLYSYVRILNSINEEWNNEPQWMSSLRIRLENGLSRRRTLFSDLIMTD